MQNIQLSNWFSLSNHGGEIWSNPVNPIFNPLQVHLASPDNISKHILTKLNLISPHSLSLDQRLKLHKHHIRLLTGHLSAFTHNRQL